MKQADFNFEAVLSMTSDILDTIKERADLVKEKNDERLQLLETDAKSLQNLYESQSGQDDVTISLEIQRVERELSSLGSAEKHLATSRAELKQKVNIAKRELEEQKSKQQSLAVHPGARYSVNVYRDMSKINWHEESKLNWQEASESHQLKGFVRCKGGLRTFCFDRAKQSSFFIVNSLWEMGEDDSEQ